MTISAPQVPLRKRDDTFERHARIDRLYHWFTAGCMLTLLATGLLPHMGLRFSAVTLHWITGIVLTLLVVFHLLRAFFWKKVRTIWFTRGELEGRQLGKYSVAQKCMHHALALVIVVSVCTGLIQLKHIDTPLLTRDTDLFSAGTWGWIYVVHGLAAVSTLTLVMVHIYFGLIPESRMYLKAMLTGRMSRADQRTRVAAALKKK